MLLAKAKKALGSPGFNLAWFGDIVPALETTDFVEGLLTSAGMSVLYGESNCGKTFLALDLGMHVALGREWFGRACDVGTVVYVAAEGGFGVRNRVAAFRLRHGLDDDAVPFGLAVSQVNLLDANADTPRLIATIHQAAEKFEQPVRLVVIDTLSRALFGGNENAPEDMGALVSNADAIRQATGAHVLFVHHLGKDDARGMRGHSLLLAAIDTEIVLERDNVSSTTTATVKKQRDLELFGVFPFRLDVIELGLNGRGKAVTSCVVTEAERPKVAGADAKLTADETAALKELREFVNRHGEEGIEPEPGMRRVTAVQRWAVKEWWIKVGVVSVEDAKKLSSSERSDISRLFKRLKAKGRIGVRGEWLWLLP